MFFTLVLLPIALMLLRLPVAFSMLIPSMIYVLGEPRLNFGIVIQRTAGLLDSFPLLAVPMFILVGFLANEARMADKLFVALLALTGKIRGSIAYANINASLVFSWMSGSAIADASAMGSVIIPSMKRSGYSPGFAAALTAASSSIGPIMPPSIPAVLYAVLTGTSVYSMFLAGIVPAFLIFIGLTLYVAFYMARSDMMEAQDGPRIPAQTALVQATPILVAPMILLGGILSGVFTPTEASAVTAFYIVLICLPLGWLTLFGLRAAIIQTVETVGRVMLIASIGGLYGFVLAREGIPGEIADMLKSLTDNPVLFLLIANIALIVVGMFLEPTSALLVTVPVLYPIALAFGIEPVHLGAIVILNLTIGLLTPPVGLVLYVLSIAGDVRVLEIVKHLIPMLGILLCVLLAITIFPFLTLLLIP